MAGELQASYQTSKTVYAVIRNRNGLVYSSSGTGGYGTYATSTYADYPVSLTEQGSASAFYVGNMPSVSPAGVYSIVVKNQMGGSPAETDPTVAVGDLQFNGTTTLPLSDLATSGQIGQIGPIRLARGVMVQNFPIYLKSAVDHVTPFVSGVVSGQIARDGGNFGVLQSGSFTEVGMGWYTLSALTSGDLAADTAKLHFTAVGISGGNSDPLPMGIVLQRVSGY